LEIKPCRKSA